MSTYTLQWKQKDIETLNENRLLIKLILYFYLIRN